MDNSSGLDALSVQCIYKVAVAGPFLEPLDYLGPQETAVIGARVKVPFRNQFKIGVLLAVASSSKQAVDKLKTITAVLDSEALFSEEHLALLKWASQYYHEPIGEVVMAALPKRLRTEEVAELKAEEYWQLQQNAQIVLPKNAFVQQKLLSCLLGKVDDLPAGTDLLTEVVVVDEPPKIAASILRKVSSAWRKTLAHWQTQGWVCASQGVCWPTHPLPKVLKHPLNSEQQLAVDSVSSSLQSGGYQAYLLQGVTGSGKTEVYLAMIEQAIAQGKQALVLVPEIGLTPQMVQRFEAYLQVPVATLHSAMNDSQRHCAWQMVREGKVSVLLGTRSAVFASFHNLGLCILDEEHDLSYKQQDGFRYSARDFLVRRAALQNIPIVLGSATPSLESLYNLKTQRYQGLFLRQRAGSARLPHVKVLDIRGETVKEGVSAPLKAAMKQHLDAGNQVLLFLNRRGFAPVLMCHQCGWQAKCPSCDANMTYHQSKLAYASGYLQCHHCDTQITEPAECPQCQSTELLKIGQGTERLQEAVHAWFPEKTVLRIDRDTTRLKGSMEKMTEQAKSGDADILLGTQMLAKGHDFPQVTLVGLLDIDQGLFSCDYRATERLAQLILQVAGRAGRAQKPGEVLIQTHHPQNPFLTQLIQRGYDEVAQSLLDERQSAILPPFSYQILIRAEAYDEALVREFLQSVKGGLELAVQQQKSVMSETAIDFRIWGPIAAPMLRRQGRYRYQLMLNSRSRKTLHHLLASIEPAIYKSKLVRKVRWSIDVDPQEMM